MARPEGMPKTGGRTKGTPNKATASARDAISQFIEGNAGKVQELWDRVAKDDPDKALDLYAKLAEFTLPKLARSEVTANVTGTLIMED